VSVMIRPGVATDATALAELATRTFSETFAADNQPEDIALHTAHAYGTPQQQRELVDPRIATLLVEVDEQLAGYAQLRSGGTPKCVTGEKPIELWRFYIARPWQGRGLHNHSCEEWNRRPIGAEDAHCGSECGSATSERRPFIIRSAS
jgi:diamine N-acetyltransferase